jgi:putative PIN family toxin of toxin-antitoxin system
LRVVVDTNVFVSSFFGGKPREIIDRWRNAELTLCLTDAVLDEYTRVLESMNLNQKELSDLLQLFREQHRIVYTTRTPELKIVDSDPSDNKFLEAAVALGAERIITGDSDLRSLEEYLGVDIQSPTEFLKTL